MTHPMITRLDERRPAVCAIAGALCLAVAAARIVLALTTPAPDLVLDAAGYDDAGRRLAGEGYYAWVYPGDEVEHPAANAMHLPGYPAFLAALYTAVGVDTAPQPLVSVVQAVLSGLTLWGVFLLGRDLKGPGTGLAATILGAAYLPFWWSYRYVLTEDLFAALCVWAAWLLLSAIREEGRRAYIAYAAAGAVASAATYVRVASAAWMLLTGAILLFLGGPERGRFLRGSGVVLLTVVLFFGPWWYRNSQIYGRFIPFNTMTSSGSLVASFDDREELVEVLESLDRGHVDPPEDIELDRKMASVARTRTREALDTDPVGYVLRRTRLVAVSFFTYHPNPFGGFSGMGGVTEALHLAVLALAAVGLWVHRSRMAVWILAGLPLSLVAVHAVTLVYSRYLFPMMPFMIVLAGLGLAAAAPREPPEGVGSPTAA